MWPRMDDKRNMYLLSLTRNYVSLKVCVPTGNCPLSNQAERLEARHYKYCRICDNENEEENVKDLLYPSPPFVRRRLAEKDAIVSINCISVTLKWKAFRTYFKVRNG